MSLLLSKSLSALMPHTRPQQTFVSALSSRVRRSCLWHILQHSVICPTCLSVHPPCNPYWTCTIWLSATRTIDDSFRWTHEALVDHPSLSHIRWTGSFWAASEDRYKESKITICTLSALHLPPSHWIEMVFLHRHSVFFAVLVASSVILQAAGFDPTRNDNVRTCFTREWVLIIARHPDGSVWMLS